MISSISIEGYRSIRAMRLSLAPVTVVLGENGAGKTTLYRALELIRAAAVGDLAHKLAREGGMPSALWAGAPAREPGEDERPGAGTRRARRIRFAVELEGVSYGLTLGLPGPADPALSMDPSIKDEAVSLRTGSRRVVMMQRKGPSVAARDENSDWRDYGARLLASETALSMLRDPAQFPEMEILQRRMSDWRFHHMFRTDAESPIRLPQAAVCAPSLDSDGSNLAATLATAIYLGDGGSNAPGPQISAAVEEAFPGSKLDFIESGGRHLVGLTTPQFPRAFTAQELSDGTLKYLCLVAALCPYRRPAFLALNEPEASLHPDLIEPLGRMIARASEESQVLIVTHSQRLARILAVEADAAILRLEKADGETRAVESTL